MRNGKLAVLGRTERKLTVRQRTGWLLTVGQFEVREPTERNLGVGQLTGGS